MKRTRHVVMQSACLLLLAPWAMPSLAEAPATTSDAALTGVLQSSAVNVDDLATQRGGTDSMLVSLQDGSDYGNTATNTVSGGNIIESGAFSNSSGIPTVIQNSGNNVLIQNSTIVNVQFK